MVRRAGGDAGGVLLCPVLSLAVYQDFNYVHSNALEITLELSCCKHPPARDLPGYWRDNRQALLAYLQLAQVRPALVMSTC